MNKEARTGTALEERPPAGAAETPKKPAAVGKTKKKKSKAGRIVAAVVVLALLASGSYVVIHRLGKKSTASTKMTEVAVTQGDIAKTITGSGAVQPAQEYKVVPTVTGKIQTDNITQGQKINEGDLIYSIDPTNAENAIKQNENALERAQVSAKQSTDAVANLTVKSDVSGVVTKVYVKDGDQVQANAPIIEVQDSSSLILTLPFNAADAANIYQGESAQVTLDASGAVLNGTVSRVYSGQQIGSGGSLVTNVDITLTNPGVVQSGATGTAVVGGQYACNAPGTIAYVSDKTVTAKTAGQVTDLSLQAGDAVSAGTVVTRLVNDQTTMSAQTAQLQVESAQLALQNSQDALKNYNITSPISGTVIEKNSKAGDTLGNTTSSTTMAVIADMSSLVLNIDVDELDILNIKVGQSATITADAIPGKTFTGQVTNVSNIGSSGSSSGTGTGTGAGTGAGTGSSTGVTTYDVEITITDYGSLLPGMNVNASIVTDSAKNVLLIPQQAVMNGGFVLRKTSGASASSAAPSASASAPASSAAPQGGGSGQSGAAGGNANFANRLKQLQASVPAGYELVRVQIGLTNSEYAEVKSGLSEGDTVAYITPAATSSTSSGGKQTTMMFGGGGGGGTNRTYTAGAMPAGGGSYGGGANRPSGSTGGGGASFNRG